MLFDRSTATINSQEGNVVTQVPVEPVDPCPICFEHLQQQDRPCKCETCKKVFHVGCIDNWFSACNGRINKTTCPACRGGGDRPFNQILSLQEFRLRYGLIQITLDMIRNNGLLLEYLTEQTEELCELAILSNWMSLRFVINQTERLCILAIQQDLRALYSVNNKTPNICQAVLSVNGLMLHHVKTWIKAFPLQVRKRLWKVAVIQNGLALLYIPKKYRNREIHELALRSNGLALKFVEMKKQTQAFCLIAVEQNRAAFHCIANQGWKNSIRLRYSDIPPFSNLPLPTVPIQALNVEPNYSFDNRSDGYGYDYEDFDIGYDSWSDS